MEKEEVLFEDETMKIFVIPNLLQIVIQCKDKGSYEKYKEIMAMLPVIQSTLKTAMGMETVE